MKNLVLALAWVLAALGVSLVFKSGLVFGAENTQYPTSQETKYLHSNAAGNIVDLADWHPKYRERCLFPSPQDTSSVASLVEAIHLIESQSSLTEPLLARAKLLQTRFCVEDRADGARGYYDFEFNIIALRESLTTFEKSLILVHELRHLQHVSKGMFMSLDYDIEEMVRLMFALEADAQAITTLFAWRSKETGNTKLWNALLTLEHYSDIAEVFELSVATAENEQDAVLAAFTQWYNSSWRVDSYHISSTMAYLDLLDDTHRIQQYNELPSDYFESLCVIADESYGCQNTDQIKMKPRQIRELARAANSK